MGGRRNLKLGRVLNIEERVKRPMRMQGEEFNIQANGVEIHGVRRGSRSSSSTGTRRPV